MTLNRSRIPVLLLWVVLSWAAHGGDDGLGFDRMDVVESADWGAMETVRVTMNEHEYDPIDHRFERGKAYRLELFNEGEEKHYFTAPEFFRAIATRKVQSDHDGEIKAPYFLALEIMPRGGKLDLYFVPVQSGTYAVYCTIDDHREQGMEGTLVIGD